MRWALKITAAFCVAAFIFSIGWVAWLVKTNPYPTYKEVCSPQHFVGRFYYYNDRVFAVCGSPDKEPIIIEIKPIGK